MRRIPIIDADRRLKRGKYLSPKYSLSPYDWTYSLRNYRAEGLRLTAQLLYMVNRIAKVIALNTDPWTVVEVKDLGYYSVVCYISAIKMKKVLVTGKYEYYEPNYACPGRAFGFNAPVNTPFLFGGEVPARTATRQDYFTFSRNIESIVNAFTVSQEELYYKILEAFTSLRHAVGST